MENTTVCPYTIHVVRLPQDEALQLCIKISTAIDQVEYMFTTEFEPEVEESESATLNQYYREAMIQGYNFAFEVRDSRAWEARTWNMRNVLTEVMVWLQTFLQGFGLVRAAVTLQ